MKKWSLIFAFVFGAGMAQCDTSYNETTFAGKADKVNYTNPAGKQGFIKTRETINHAPAWSGTVGTTSQTLKFPKPPSSVTVINTDSTDNLYVNFAGNLALNQDQATGKTTAGDATFQFHTDVSTWGLQVGDIVYMDTGDGNDGAYAIIGVSNISANEVELDHAPTVTANYTQEYTVQSFLLAAGESVTVSTGSQFFALIGDTSAVTYKVMVTYQKGTE